MDRKVQHLQMIEQVIERLAHNSFALKGWAVTLVSAICAFSAANTERRFIYVAFVPAIMFWLLDAYYLSLERKYKDLYRAVASMKEEEINFTLDAKPYGKGKANFKNRWPCCVFALSEVLFYLPIALVTIYIICELNICIKQ